MDVAEPVDNGFSEVFHRGAVADIDEERLCIAPTQVDCFVESGPVYIGAGDASTAPREFDGECATNPRASTGDDGCLSR